MGMFVLGVLQTSTRGWSDPVVIGLIVGGLSVLGVFVWWIKGRERKELPSLLHPSIFRHRAIGAGLPILATQTFAQAGLLFLVPVFTQSVLGFDAFQTGLALLPLSIGVLVTSVATAPLGRKIYPKYIVQVGLVLLFIGGAILAGSLETAVVTKSGTDLALGLLIGGIAIGLIVGQLPNLILSSVEQDEASEASGLLGTFQNLGMALGTAVIGTVILSVGISSIGASVDDSQVLTDDVKAGVGMVLDRPMNNADAEELNELIRGLPADQQDELRSIYETSTIDGFQGAIIAGGIVALFGAALAFRLPKKKFDSDASVEQTVEEIVRNPSIPGMQLEMDDFAPSSKP
jgi:MFS family permease